MGRINPILFFKDGGNMNIINPYRFAAGGVDPDAQTYIDALELLITVSEAQKGYIDTLFKELKGDGTTFGNNVYAKLYFAYPFFGGTAGTHAINMINPGTFDLTFAGTLTHDANGVTPNGTSGRATNGFLMSTQVDITNDGWGQCYYARTALPVTSAQTIGQGWNSALNAGYGFNHNVTVSFISGGVGAAFGITSAAFYHGYGKFGTGLNFKTAENGVVTTSATTFPSTKCDREIPLFCRQYALAYARYSSVNCAFAADTKDMTDNEAADFYEAIQNFQISLGRQV